MAAKKAPARKRKPSNKKITLNEFHAWLEGVEELQPDGWSPDADQWELIRNKIMNIVEAEPEYIEVPVASPAPAPAPMPQMQSTFVTGDTPNTPGMNPAPAPAAFTPPASSFGDTQVDMTPEARAALSGKLPAGMTPAPDGKIKTPNVDTSDGNFTSGFE